MKYFIVEKLSKGNVVVEEDGNRTRHTPVIVFAEADTLVDAFKILNSPLTPHARFIINDMGDQCFLEDAYLERVGVKNEDADLDLFDWLYSV